MDRVLRIKPGRRNVNVGVLRGSGRLAWLLLLGSLQCILYGIITGLSSRFGYETKPAERPILVVTGLFLGAFALYLLSLWTLLGRRSGPREGFGRGETGCIFIFACLFRGVLFFSCPIQETDFYRYLWDGRVVLEGINPYRFSPDQVLQSRPGTPSENAALERLSALRWRSPAVATILSRINHPAVPTIYPPVSQAVFGLAAFLTPASADLQWHLLILKLVLLGFDLGTSWVVWRVLLLLKKPIGLLAIYAWCPLVLKEIANSGHMDSIPVFFCVVAVWFFLRLNSGGSHRACPPGRFGIRLDLCLAMGAWFLATLAKFYPIALGFAFTGWLWRGYRWRSLLLMGAYGVSLMLVYLVGAALSAVETDRASVNSRPSVSRQGRASGEPAAPAKASNGDHVLGGLSEFMKRWEINDLVFMLVYENLRVHDTGNQREAGERARVPWFVLVNGPYRRGVEGRLGWVFDTVGLPRLRSRASFLFTQAVLDSIWMLAAGLAAIRLGRDREGPQMLRVVFLSLAWFWIVSPAQNPWYWIWCLPFAFAVGWPWYLYSGFLLLYDLRFWLLYHYPGPPTFGLSASGREVFDYGVVWLEHGVVLGVVGAVWLRERLLKRWKRVQRIP